MLHLVGSASFAHAVAEAALPVNGSARVGKHGLHVPSTSRKDTRASALFVVSRRAVISNPLARNVRGGRVLLALAGQLLACVMPIALRLLGNSLLLSMTVILILTLSDTC